ncbi:rod shape-determining protein MreC [Helicobacter cholecystus]|uniref:Rod shape-determining protein MreC n=1 Tax=Helicobacter cholecystus TaxID=45498 RepID=A0A3D8IYH9_9HELI|nr:rod shape-determining protein MreC [Helicobacter cholecystus]RDU70046.1 rod shape-determining protein MreC [Helicobacter cholecystus]VEJ24784.1 rod shape-determining protein [Helicobacter cholecystus]
MRIKPFFILVFLFVAITIFFKLDHSLRGMILSLGDEVKNAVFDFKEWGKETYLKYFNQAQNIQELNKKLAIIQKIELQNIQLKEELQRLTTFYNMPSLALVNIVPVRAISYCEFGNYERLWLSGFESGVEGKIYGLVLDGAVVGIAKLGENGRLMGLLNGDPLCSYGVYIGEGKVSGIFRSVDGQVEISYIPMESKIKVGDKIATNGMDNIFFENIPVGEVSEIIEGNGYLKAKIKTYAPKVNLGYMWLLDRSENAK